MRLPHLTVMLYIRYLQPLRRVEDLFHERGFDICHDTVGAWWNRLGSMFTSVHASIHNRFNQERHLYSRENFKINRDDALAEWRQRAA